MRDLRYWLASSVALIVLSLSSPVQAEWPWKIWEGTPRIDVIGPLGNRLPASYRRQYNRPSYLGGKMAAAVAPSSQEAMAFKRADAMGLYDNNGVKGLANKKHCPPQRVEHHYFYPKPWEVLTVGPRVATRSIDADLKSTSELIPLDLMELDAPTIIELPSAEELPAPKAQLEGE